MNTTKLFVFDLLYDLCWLLAFFQDLILFKPVRPSLLALHVVRFTQNGWVQDLIDQGRFLDYRSSDDMVAVNNLKWGRAQ